MMSRLTTMEMDGTYLASMIFQYAGLFSVFSTRRQPKLTQSLMVPPPPSVMRAPLCLHSLCYTTARSTKSQVTTPTLLESRSTES
ncbi:hypothetical protein VNO78_17433 [Psophocarpus tetragonolobus]|uniref:Uncharacterized protein n=1 Tax=Psophocarpus tetragonolobus TaxID=3891 RepID=A0AAN9XLD3_PSOTE